MNTADAVFSPSKTRAYLSVPDPKTAADLIRLQARRRSAALAVCGLAADNEAAGELLDMLGLRPLVVA